jgi:flagellar biosynthesis protein FlhB
MAKPEQTEKATPKRRKEAREKGQVPRSQELAGSVIFLAAVFILYASYGPAITGIENSIGRAFLEVRLHEDPTLHSAWLLILQALAPVAVVLSMLLGVAFAIGIIANIAQFGLLFSLKPITPSFGKLNPISGFARLFSKQTLVNFAKQILKLGAVGVILYQAVSKNIDLLGAIGQTTPTAFVAMVAQMVFSIAWQFSLLLVFVGVLDYLWTRYQLEDSLKMTKQEVKDELRQYEGNPEAKSALKRRQREFARRRMMASVPRATVVVVNPTHFAVALQWDELEMEAPVVTAKGADFLARRIRELAEEHDVPIMENAPLARALYERVEIDQMIPPNLYAAVAQVIAFVFKLKRKTIA